MKKSIQVLMLVLIAQCLILASVLFQTGKNSENKTQKLLDLDFSSIDSLTINDENGELEVLKQGESWYLPAYGELTVKNERVDEVLQELEAIEVSWPVASTADAAERFEVSLENAQKTLKFKSGQEILAKLYVGTSPGYRKVHVRRGDNDNIFAVDLSQYRLSSKGQDWFDKNLLAYAGEPTTITVGDTSFNFAEGQWQISGQDVTQLDQEKIKTWVKNISTLSVIGLVEEAQKSDVAALTPVVLIAVQGSTGSSNLELRNQDEKFYIQRSGAANIFEIARYQAEKFSKLDSNEFLVSNEENSLESSSQELLPAENFSQ